MPELPVKTLLGFGVSLVASLLVIRLVWRRDDPVFFKIFVTLVALIPFIGPVAGLWVTTFPDKMHPDMQAKYKNTVNSYSFPTAPAKATIKNTAEAKSPNNASRH